MKKVLLCSIVYLFYTLAFGQNSVQYGSNGGHYLTINKTKVYYEEYGQGTPLILLQGGMGSIADFSSCIPELSKRFRVIAPDTPGQGRSELADSMSYTLLADYISKMIDLLKLDSAYVMGWSDGGNMALILGSNRPDKVKKVIASGANYKRSGYPSLQKDTTSWKKKMSSSNLEKDNKGWIDQYNKLLPRDWRKMMMDIHKMWYREIYFSPRILESLKIPVMIVLGDRDEVTLEHAIEMHRLIKKSQFCVLPKTSHAVFRERSSLINTIAIDFFTHKQ
jgi:pimeloyl-ACP methyl ester carboxylesterase